MRGGTLISTLLSGQTTQRGPTRPAAGRQQEERVGEDQREDVGKEKIRRLRRHGTPTSRDLTRLRTEI